MRHYQRGIATTVILIIFLLAGIAIASGIFIFSQKQQAAKQINSFEACAKLYPVMESYPEQCNTPDGRHFVREVKEKQDSIEILSEICPEINPVIKDSPTIGYKNYVGHYEGACNLRFSVDFPEVWELRGNILYPIEGGDAKIVLGAGGHGWPEEMIIETRPLPSGGISYSWGKPAKADYIIGFANIHDLENSLIIEVSKIPVDKSQEIQAQFNQLIESVKFFKE